jgi:hypothetical protein
VGGLQKKLPAAMKEKEAASVFVVKVVQEKTSVLVAQGAQETEAPSVEKRRGATTSVQELRTHVVEKKKQPDIESVQKVEVAYVESVRKENATFHSTSKKKDMAAVISQQKSQSQASHTATHMLCK